MREMGDGRRPTVRAGCPGGERAAGQLTLRPRITRPCGNALVRTADSAGDGRRPAAIGWEVIVDERRRADLLRQCPLFAELPDADLTRLAAVARPRRYSRQQILFGEGDTADSMLVVCEGSLKALSSSAEGESFLLAVVGPGDTLGELTVADGGLRSATVTAVTDVLVLRLPRDDVLRVAATSPALVAALLGSLAAVVRRLTGSAADLVFLDIPRRVAKLLLTLPPTGANALTQAEMADRVGASRQSLNAALQEFQRRGWISVARREIGVHDRTALRSFVGE